MQMGQRTKQQTRQQWKAQAGVFLAIAFVAAGALGAVQPATGIPSEVLQLTQFGPALAVAVAALLWPALTRGLLAGHPTGTAVRRRVLIATAPSAILLAAGSYALFTGAAHVTDPRSLHHSFLLVLGAQLVGACGEEIGWRCFLQPLLRTRFRPVTASVVVGVAWGLWHVQVLAGSPAYAAGFLLATTAMSVVLGVALDEARGYQRLLLAGAFHCLINLGMLLVMDEETGRAAPMVLFGLACAATALPWMWRGRRGAPVRIAERV
ncbi:CPBP family intramembrane glutamic endopeptidase [Streptomyces sp. NPDC059828]|uniref:CPBP family intramembrane glutamic endopeptidase n=1 Tax=Streptomyces sp. NPDC059828 TaxID=3346965 RepID=UPI00365998C8